MTNATEAPAKTIAEQVAEARAKHASAVAANDAARAAFTALMSSGGKNADGTDASIEDQLKVSQAALNAPALVDQTKAALDRLVTAERLETLDKPTTSVRDALKTALTRANLGKLMRESDAGNSITFTATFDPATVGEDGSVTWAVASKYVNVAAPRAPRAASDGATGGTRAKLEIVTPDGTFGSKDYVFKYFDAAKSAGYASSRDSAAVVPANEYAKIAPVMADKLGHTVNRS